MVKEIENIGDELSNLIIKQLNNEQQTSDLKIGLKFAK